MLGSGEKRTAVLVVHGMGSQRPLDTVRGVIDAVWLKGDQSAAGARRIWTHPERSGVEDIDLPVITTNFLPGPGRRRFDFHELYWAHLMSETRAVAVLLWLLELARMGPRLKPSISAVYWGALIFLAALILSVSLLAIQIIVLLAGSVAGISKYAFDGDLHSMAYVLAGSIAVTAFFAMIAALSKRSFRLVAILLAIGSVSALLFALIFVGESQTPIVHGTCFDGSGNCAAEALTRALLPVLVAVVVTYFTMGRWGLAGLAIVMLLSWGVGGLALYWFKPEQLSQRIPWSIISFWSTMAACYFIGLYLALNAAFLQSYLGDAARYFRNSPANVAVRREIRRQAVNTLQTLHLSGEYDRIVVVAHSLGTVVAYDMLRAYYSRINDALPDPSLLGDDFDRLDRGAGVAAKEARKGGREIVRRISRAVDDARSRIVEKRSKPEDEKLKAWLVTDFVTMGSPLTHALYLMCRGKTEGDLRDDFERRVREREFPTCPPRILDEDNRMTFENPKTRKREFHHGGQFALTRWTNLYFPASELLWGDAIGGEVGSLFGEHGGSQIADVPVYTNSEKRNSFFAHVLYWQTAAGAEPPHIAALSDAVDLADEGAANDPLTIGVRPAASRPSAATA